MEGFGVDVNGFGEVNIRSHNDAVTGQCRTAAVSIPAYQPTWFWHLPASYFASQPDWWWWSTRCRLQVHKIWWRIKMTKCKRRRAPLGKWLSIFSGGQCLYIHKRSECAMCVLAFLEAIFVLKNWWINYTGQAGKCARGTAQESSSFLLGLLPTISVCCWPGAQTCININKNMCCCCLQTHCTSSINIDIFSSLTQALLYLQTKWWHKKAQHWRKKED